MADGREAVEQTVNDEHGDQRHQHGYAYRGQPIERRVKDVVSRRQRLAEEDRLGREGGETDARHTPLVHVPAGTEQ